MSVRAVLLVLAIAVSSTACERELDPESFKRAAEKAYIETHPGWGIVRRDSGVTTFVRGDQVDTLDVGKLYEEYRASKKPGSEWLEGWSKRAEEEAKARKRTLDQAKNVVIPIVKSGSWIRVQDLGAIGPKNLQDRIRPWRKEMASDVYALLGVPEEGLGFRFASIEEVKELPEGEQAYFDRAIANLRAKVGTSTASEMNTSDGRLMIYDLSGYESISGMIFDPQFRAKMFDRFQKDELGASAPIRDVLIIFDTAEFTATRPIRARTHQLYDTQNHPGFRGLIRFDRAGLSVLEAANPEQKKKPAQE
jgi:hypothetical protein